MNVTSHYREPADWAHADTHDHLVTNTDATPGAADGEQFDVSQEPTAEHEVQDDSLAGVA